MKTIAIIAEFNPFHRGHAYLIDAARALSGASHVVVVMSGNFVQRGEPAILDKFNRTDQALRAGADLVLELPAASACGSAQRFAEGAAAILDSLAIVDELWFGSESGDLSSLTALARILADEPASYREELRAGLSLGLSFPRARQLAMKSFAESGLLADPNNILAVEYIRALVRLGSSIQPRTLRRMGAAYSSSSLPDPTSESFASATALRRLFLSGDYRTESDRHLDLWLPSWALDSLRSSADRHELVSSDDFSDSLLYALQLYRDRGYENFLDIGPDFSNRILRRLPEFRSFEHFAEVLTSKNYTRAYCRRALLHILLNIGPLDLSRQLSPSYIRVLGFNPDRAEEIFSQLKKACPLPLITKGTDYQAVCSAADRLADRLYYAVQTKKSGLARPDERSIPVRKIPSSPNF